MTSVPSRGFDELQGHRYVALTTRRRSGQVVTTPVWFVIEDATVYVMTDGRSGKAKRIRNDPHVQLAPSDVRGRPRGAAVEGAASIMAATHARHPAGLLAAKYGWQYRLLTLVHRRWTDHSVMLEITPGRNSNR